MLRSWNRDEIVERILEEASREGEQLTDEEIERRFEEEQGRLARQESEVDEDLE